MNAYRILSVLFVVTLSACGVNDRVSIESTSLSSEESQTLSEVTDIPDSDADCEQFAEQYALPSTTAQYSNAIISFSMPFNPSWGMESFVVAEGTILFGTPRMGYSDFDGCGERRDYWYSTREKRTAAEAKEYYETEFPVDPSDVVIRTIGSLETISITNVQGVCPHPFIEIIGKNENHLFSTSCEAVRELDDALNALEEIIESVTLK